MKRYLLIAMLGVAACNNAKNSNETTAADTGTLSPGMVRNPHTASGLDATVAADKPVMSFKDTVFNFGSIYDGELVKYDFEFTNTGKTPLIISYAAGTCGCTVPEYPHDPIAPGKSGVIKVTFNSAGKQGTQQKTVILHANTVRASHQLYLEGEVKKSKQ